MAMISPEGRELERQRRERQAGPELAAALRKVTTSLRFWMKIAEDDDPKMLEHEGVLEAEALLKRIDEGG